MATSKQIGLSSGKVQYPVIVNRPDVAEQVTEKTEVGDGAMQVDMVEVVGQDLPDSCQLLLADSQWSNPDALRCGSIWPPSHIAEKTDAAAAALVAGADATPTAGWQPTPSRHGQPQLPRRPARSTRLLAAMTNMIYADPVTGYELMGWFPHASARSP